MQLSQLSTVAPKSSHGSVSDAEWDLRVELAACYRIFDLLGWTELIFNHISLRVPGSTPSILINPFGLRYREVTASNLIKIDLSGDLIGESDWPVNPAGSIIHTAIHRERPDVHAVMHTHTTAGSAVAGLRGGLDGNNFYSAMLADQVAYHDFEGITLEPQEQQRLVQDLGDRNILVLRNHGILTAGATLAAAFFRLWTIERACEIQMAMLSAGVPVTEVSAAARGRSSADFLAQMASPRAGTRAFEALQRELDQKDPSYRQ
ncbi:MAG TPA: class II aldolase/adducin family protein [Acidimicrobiales bacterium]|nr:class II aldolase/adducin family protein [Acidimicrobiales bacterium]